ERGVLRAADSRRPRRVSTGYPRVRGGNGGRNSLPARASDRQQRGPEHVVGSPEAHARRAVLPVAVHPHRWGHVHRFGVRRLSLSAAGISEALYDATTLRCKVSTRRSVLLEPLLQRTVIASCNAS